MDLWPIDDNVYLKRRGKIKYERKISYDLDSSMRRFVSKHSILNALLHRRASDFSPQFKINTHNL
jgi:hypothetical protein